MERAGAVFAPIPSLRSCAAYRPAALRRRNRQAACAKKAMDQAHAWGSPGQGSGSLAGSRHRDGYPTGSVSDSRA